MELSLLLLFLTGLIADPVTSREWQPEPLIRGGVPVDPVGKWPWMAMVERQRFGRPQFHCGGVLISAEHVLTAARCLEFHISEYRVSLGVHDRRNREEGDPQRVELASYVRHPVWINDRELGHPGDICVVRLRERANVGSEFISPIIMPPDDNRNPPSFIGTTCFISGWGNVGRYGQPMDELHEARLEVIEEELCQVMYDRYPVTRMHVCAWDVNRQRVSPCEGDEGGPLMCQVSGSWMLAGISSWRGLDCDENYPAVFSRISYYKEWISSQTGIP